jgi:hypothetical protein
LEVEEGDAVNGKRYDTEKAKCLRTRRKGKIAYHSPPAPPSPLRLGSCVLPAAAEAKLDGSGVGIMDDRKF